MCLLLLLAACAGPTAADSAPKSTDSTTLPCTAHPDADGDGFGDGATTSCDGVADGTDCDDGDATVYPGAAEVCDGADQDCDGVADNALATSVRYDDADGDGYGDDTTARTTCLDEGTLQGGDCDDADPARNPAAAETENGTDDDCDGTTDEGTAAYDDDGDGTSEEHGDCDDADPTRYPGATELPDGIDQDCDGVTDEGTVLYDDDGDGYTEDGGDCDDTRGTVHPGQDEICDGRDDDCDGTIDVDAVDGTTYYPDADTDGYGDDTAAVVSCMPIAHDVTRGGDCDDGDRTIHTGAVETCDSVDDDCDSLVDDADPDLSDPRGLGTFSADADGDGFGDPTVVVTACVAPAGYAEDATDCDDTAATTFPGAPETCDGIDEDCGGDGDLPAEGAYAVFADEDGDGYGDDAHPVGSCTPDTGALLTGGDCDDADADVHPGVREVCGNGIDDDCADGDATDCAPMGVGTAADAWLTVTGGTGYLGAGLVIADLDGDGVDDLAIGAPVDDTAGTDAGLVAIFYGPLTAGTVALTDADVLYLGEAAGDAAGKHLAVGDVDGDGVSDLIVVARGANAGAGRVYVLRGGTLTSGSLATASATIDGAAGEAIGYDLDVGDVDGDGLTDVVVGVPDALTEGRGEVWLYSGASLTGPLTRDDATTVFESDLLGGALGEAVAVVPNLRGDGVPGLVLGDGAVNPLGILTDGVLYVLPGPFAAGEVSLRGTPWGLLDFDNPSDWGRRVVDVGDLDGDGRPELVVSDPGSSSGESGALHVLRGPPAYGWVDLADTETIDGASKCRLSLAVAGVGDVDEDGLGDLAFACYETSSGKTGPHLAYGPAELSTSADAEYRMEASSRFYSFGIAAGDLDGDGHRDVAWGADTSVIVVHGGQSPAETVVTPEVPGTDADADGYVLPSDCDDSRSDVHPGATETCGDGLDADCSGADLRCAISGDTYNSDFTEWTPSSGADFLAAFPADLDGDGADDLVLSEHDAEYGGSTVGGLAVMWGPIPSWNATFDQADAFLYGTSGYSVGYTLVPGDIDGDGLLDLVSATPYASHGGSSAGHVDVIGNSGRWTGDTVLGSTLATIDGAKDEEIGFGLVVGDFDGDGLGDVVVASGDNYGGEGAVWLFSEPSGALATSDADARLDGESANSDPCTLAVADVDGDGTTDLLVGDPGATITVGSGSVYVFTGPVATGTRSLGTADAKWTHPAAEMVGTGLSTGDLDGDGSTDVLVGTYDGHSYLRFGPLTLADEDVDAGVTTTLTWTDTSYCGGLGTFADLDGDGHGDLVGHCDHTTYGWYGPIDATTSLSTTAPDWTLWETSLTSEYGALGAGDLDGDGVDDLVDSVGEYTSAYVDLAWGGGR